MEEFIETVRITPCLWNPTNKKYRDMNKKDAAWQDIVNRLKCDQIPDIKTARAEWKKLRDNHRDSLKRLKAASNEQSGERTNMWRYAENMDFLLPYMKNRKRTQITLHSRSHESDIEENSPGSHNKSENWVSVDHSSINVEAEDSHGSDHSRSNDEGDISNTRKRSYMGNDLIKILQENHYERHDEGTLRRSETKHPLDSFFDSMCETTKQFPAWMQKQVKRQIFTVISEAEDTLDNSYNYSNTETKHRPI